jgi:hypothetical protein
MESYVKWTLGGARVDEGNYWASVKRRPTLILLLCRLCAEKKYERYFSVTNLFNPLLKWRPN